MSRNINSILISLRKEDEPKIDLFSIWSIFLRCSRPQKALPNINGSRIFKEEKKKEGAITALNEGKRKNLTFFLSYLLFPSLSLSLSLSLSQTHSLILIHFFSNSLCLYLSLSNSISLSKMSMFSLFKRYRNFIKKFF